MPYSSRFWLRILPCSIAVGMGATTSCTSVNSAPASTVAPAAMAQNTAADSQATSTPQSSQQTPPPTAGTQPAQRGRVDQAPSNIRRFRPEETGLVAGVPADKIDLRKIFEELGPDATLWYQHVQTLANPFFEGRAPGTHGGELAAEYIEFYMKMYGLEPAFPSAADSMGSENVKAFSSYRQPFDFESPSPEIKVIQAAASFNGDELTENKDFVVLGNSANGSLSGHLAFVGYGIEHGKEDYSSFDDKTDLSGRIAIVLRYEPLDEHGRSQWSEARFSQFSGIAAKMKSVTERGAAGIILVNPPGAADGKSGLETLKESRRFGKQLGVPVVQVTPEIADRIIKTGDPKHRDLLALRRLADKGEIKTENLDDAAMFSLTTKLDVNDRLTMQNVGGVLRGKGNLADQWIVIGAHYDHVGTGYTGAMPNNIGKLHPGADDNASGTAGMLIAARRFAKLYGDQNSEKNLRSILFVAFGAEEAGLIGSKYLVENPPMSLGSVDLMINMDMIGRLRSNNLLVQGTGTADGFETILKPIFEGSGLRISESPGGRGPSDHSSFYGEKIPVLFLFTGEHAEYHQPTDRAYTVNPAGAVKVIDLLEALAMHFAAMPDRLRFAESTGGGSAPARETGAKVSLGTMPDYTAELETGMRVDSVRKGSSADEAGIQGGDILLTWNDQEITGARKLAELLAKAEPGEKVKIALRRGSEEKIVEVVLKARAAE